LVGNVVSIQSIDPRLSESRVIASALGISKLSSANENSAFVLTAFNSWALDLVSLILSTCFPHFYLFIFASFTCAAD
jgi:hypothetical protein